MINGMQHMDIHETRHLFNPYFYTADESFELRPQEWVRIYFDHVSDYNCGLHAHWRAYSTCLKRQHVLFVLQNSSDLSILKIPQHCRLLDILLMPDIKSCVLPVTCSYAFSDK